MIEYSKFTDNIGSGNFTDTFCQNNDKFEKSGGRGEEGEVGGGGVVGVVTPPPPPPSTHTHTHKPAQHALEPSMNFGKEIQFLKVYGFSIFIGKYLSFLFNIFL